MSQPCDPKPGTTEARKAGCACPVMDNAHGKGRYANGEKYGWWVSGACPLHAQSATRVEPWPTES